MGGHTGGNLGDYIRAQRRLAQVSLRQLAKLAGISNPYLSQIERGLRKPSADILQQIAKGLQISAETLYLQAGMLAERTGDTRVANAILADPTLTGRQRQVLLDIYESFCAQNARDHHGGEASAPAADDEPVERPTAS